MSYNWSAVGEMNYDELDRLKELNDKKMHDIEQKFHQANEKIETAAQIMRERKETFSIKEPKKDAHDKYPSYGRGLKDPGVKLNTFMVQEQMCDDPKEEKRKKERASSNSPMSEKSPVRKKIVSPKRSRFEKRFREYLEKKFITD